jgi:hypothetical protein
MSVIKKPETIARYAPFPMIGRAALFVTWSSIVRSLKELNSVSLMNLVFLVAVAVVELELELDIETVDVDVDALALADFVVAPFVAPFVAVAGDDDDDFKNDEENDVLSRCCCCCCCCCCCNLNGLLNRCGRCR